MKVKELTKAEEEVMQILWKLETAFVRDILEKMPEPKPAYNTVSTIVRILQQKGMVDYKAFGKSHQYFPLISEEQYRSFKANGLLKNYFKGSLPSMLSFFLEKKQMSTEELDEILKLINRQKQNS